MFDNKKISDSLFGIVGVRQPLGADAPIISEKNKESRSGLFVNDSAFAEIENLRQTQNYDEINDDEFNELLDNIQKKSIIDVLDEVMNSEDDFLGSNVIYPNTFNKINVEDNLPNGFIGFELKPHFYGKNVGFKISNAFFDFDGEGEITIYVFNTNIKKPIFTKTIVIDSDHVSDPINIYLSNSEAFYKGTYYIGYFVEDLKKYDLKPYKRDYISQEGRANFISTFKGLFVKPVYVMDAETAKLFDLTKIMGSAYYSGLNLYIATYLDYSDFIIKNESIFARAIMGKMIYYFFTYYCNTTRSNIESDRVQYLVEKALVESFGATGVNWSENNKPNPWDEMNNCKSEIKRLKAKLFDIGKITVISRY